MGGMLFGKNLFLSLWTCAVLTCFGVLPGRRKKKVMPAEREASERKKTGVFGFASFLYFAALSPVLSRAGPKASFLLIMLWPLSLTDLLCRRLPNRLIILSLTGFLLLEAGEMLTGKTLFSYKRLIFAGVKIFAALAAALVFKSAVGGGDIKVILMTALFSSGEKLLLLLLLSFAAAWPVALYCFFKGGRRRGRRLPFMPFWLIGSLAAEHLILYFGLQV